MALISPALIESRTSFEPSKPTTITSVRPAASSAAMAPIAIVSLPEITPLMSGLACRIDSIFVKASVWHQLARLLRDHLQVGILVDHVVVALGADAGVGVGLLADQLGVVALLAHQLDELLGAQLAPW